jgi:hypothetical protein
MSTLEALLGENQIIVHGYLERTSAGGDVGQFFDDMLVIGQKVIRRTDGSIFVVSRHAIFDGNSILAHYPNSCWNKLGRAVEYSRLPRLDKPQALS